jgi:PAS domain S-box-containing protein
MKKPGQKHAQSDPGKAPRTPKSRGAIDEFQQRLFAAQQELREQHKKSLSVQEKLRAARARYTALFSRAPVAYAVLDPSGAVLEINEAGVKLLGRSAAMIRHSRLQQFLHPDDRLKFDDHLSGCHRGASNVESELRFEAAGRPPFATRVITSPLNVDENSGSELLTTIVDISSLKQIEEELAMRVDERDELLVSERSARAELEHANRAKDELLATLSHELRTPLNAILGWTQLLGPGQVASGDVLRGIEVIDRNARTQSQIINDLLDMSRIAAGKLRLQLSDVNLCEVLDVAAGSILPVAEAKGLRLIKEIPAEPVFVRGDMVRLQQVAGNLLANAVKFTPSGGWISAKIEPKDESRADIVISDSGIGIDPSFLEKIFERFTQRDSSSTRQHGGLGLGLAIVEQLTQMHGGDASAHSDGEGKGATFRISLPAISRNAVTVDRTTTSPARLEGLKVLAVDDEDDARQVLSRVLQCAGARVQTTASATEALRLLQETSFDVLLSDLAMPGMDGCQLIQAIREAEQTSGEHLRAIALTAYSRREDHSKAESAGFDDLLVKPVELPALLSLLQRQAAHKRKAEYQDTAATQVAAAM